ncbi:MAG: hypothetical protein QGG86_02060 [Candidatus Marinimicrobia bacterium]|nr:hypothetical protein [Candidatus Neomarinimicrobiota bacterium]
MKIILIVIACLLFSNIGYAEWRVINQKTIKPDHMTLKNTWNVPVSTICVDGYKFVVKNHSIVQFFKRVEGKSLPTKC